MQILIMSFFYHPELISKTGIIQLSREESQHISKILRAQIGDKISLLDGNGQKATAEVTAIPRNRGQVECRILEVRTIPEPKKKIHLYIAPPRHNILTGLTKQCVELGVWEIHFIECEYSVAKPKDKADSLLKDIIAGAKQSENPFFPKIHKLTSFSEALEECQLQKVLGAVPNDNFPKFNPHPSEESLALWIGPEGGFSEKEKRALRDTSAESLCIGEWVLRVETAVIGLISILNH
jgi:16S rRNA (uracil1498-N3)-methyltransferase